MAMGSKTHGWTHAAMTVWEERTTPIYGTVSPPHSHGEERVVQDAGCARQGPSPTLHLGGLAGEDGGMRGCFGDRPTSSPPSAVYTGPVVQLWYKGTLR